MARLARWAARVLRYDLVDLEARSARTEELRQRAIAARKESERVLGYRDVRLHRRW